MHKITRTHATLLAIVATTFAGAVIRLINVSNYLVYSDSYQTLVGAKNIIASGSIYATLGPFGMEYPQYFGWTRPLLPLLVAALHLLTRIDLVTTAHIVLFTISVASIPLAYLAVRAVTASRAAGIAACVCLAVSFNHSVWSGFVLTESLGVFLQLALAASFATALRASYTTRFWILPGTILGLCIAARYEYAVLILPLLLMSLIHRVSFKKQAALYAASLVTLAPLLLLAGSFRFPYVRISEQVTYPILIAGLIVFVLVILAVVCKIFMICVTRSQVTRTAYIAVPLMIVLLVTLFHPSGLVRFVADDFIISISALIGFVLLLRRYTRSTLAILAGAVLLYGVYYVSNATMERYLTHLLPFLLIAAGYGAAHTVCYARGRRLVAGSIGALLFAQIALTGYGLIHDTNGTWSTRGYEDIVAHRTTAYAPAGSLVVSAMPEPHYIFGDAPVTSLIKGYPYVSIAGIPDATSVVIVNDAGMKEYFPGTYAFFARNLRQYKKDSLAVSNPLRTRTNIEYHPVKADIYILTKKELMTIIVQNGKNQP